MKFHFLKSTPSGTHFGLADDGETYYFDRKTGHAEKGETITTRRGGWDYKRVPVTNSEKIKEIAAAVEEKLNERV